MNTVLFSTDVAAAAFQYNHYTQYKLWDALCFCKDWAWPHVKSYWTRQSWGGIGTAYNIVSFRKHLCGEMHRCIRRLEPKVDTVYSSKSTSSYLYPRVFRNYGNEPHLQHCVRRWHFGMSKSLHRKVLISFYNDAHMFSTFFFICITFGCLTGA